MTPSTWAASRAVSGVPWNLKNEFCAAVCRLASDHDGIGRVGEQPDAIRSAFTSRTTSRVPFGRRSWAAPALIAPR